MSHTIGTSDEKWTRDRTKPRGSRENPVGFNPNYPEDVRPWNRARQCFRCQQWGHRSADGRKLTRKTEQRGSVVGPPFKSNRNGWRGGGNARAAMRSHGEYWDEGVDGSDGEGENVCDIPGHE
jgi:hypothetical protein